MRLSRLQHERYVPPAVCNHFARTRHSMVLSRTDDVVSRRLLPLDSQDMHAVEAQLCTIGRNAQQHQRIPRRHDIQKQAYIQRMEPRQILPR